MFGGNNSSKGSSGGMTTIVDCVEVSGSIKGCGGIHIDGKIYGDIEVNDEVIVGEQGVVNGNVVSSNVTISGTVNGQVSCDNLEVTTSGAVMDTVTAKNLVTDGLIKASVDIKESAKVLVNGKVVTEKISADNLMVEGSIEGSVESRELLEVKHTGSVEGNLVVKNIKTDEGGKIFGSMSRFEGAMPEIKSEPSEEEE